MCIRDSANSVRRLLRERSNLFFVFALPMLLILVLGAAFGGEVDPRVGVVSTDSGALAAELRDALDSAEGIAVRDYADRDSVILAVERGQLEAALILPAGYEEPLRAGSPVVLEFVGRPDPTTQALR